jgi:Raf kinase inhibitor-like YbhB/YbcL family protein
MSNWRQAAALLGAALAGPGPAAATQGVTAMNLESPAFAPNGPIPPRHTCDGADLSPPLAWNDLPPGTRSLALIVDDPDAPDPAAPQRTWVHWIVYNLPPTLAGLPEAVAPLPAGSAEGHNDWQATGYRGPCPPIGRHRYVHKLYALDTILPELHPPTKSQLESAMRGHVLAEARLVGLYQRSK